MGSENKNLLMMMMTMMMVVVVSEAQVHHVVGEDRGWDVGSDVVSWASARVFVDGDFLWFAYSGLHKDNVVELKSKEEFESCDLSDPIKMYTDGLDRISLEGAGIRYFASSNLDNCKKGLKLPVEIKPKSTARIPSSSSSSSSKDALRAQEPTAPSSATAVCGPIMIIIVGLTFTLVAI